MTRYPSHILHVVEVHLRLWAADEVKIDFEALNPLAVVLALASKPILDVSR
jgi:hypothetical protein